MRTVHTSPNGLADVVDDGSVFRVRVRDADGSWRTLRTTFYTPGESWRAVRQADRADAAREAERQRRGLFLRHDTRRV